MVTHRKLVTVDEVIRILKSSNGNVKTAIHKVENLEPSRKPAPPCPDGGISQNAGAKKYNVPQRCVSRWASKGYIPILLKTDKAIYIDEIQLAEVASVYNKKPGRGRRTVQKKYS